MKTKILYSPKNGWYDYDDPQDFYITRSLARIARQNRVGARKFKTSGVTSQTFKLTNVTTVVPVKPGQATTLDQLQQRLFDRLTKQQGLTDPEAIDIILNKGFGYNQAASYGHMRQAGATDFEAIIVLGFKNPELSRQYGVNRKNGMSHYIALTGAKNAVSQTHTN